MSLISEFPLKPLPKTNEVQVPIENYLQVTTLINDALDQVKGKPIDNLTNYPDYYDDLLKELIDAVPLE